MAEGDLEIPPVSMAQTMSIMASVVGTSFSLFFKPEDDEEHKVMMSYLCIAVFLNQFCNAAKHKDKMIGVIEAVLAGLKETVNAQPE